MRKQEEGEPVDAFITALYALAEHCSFVMLHDELIRDRIVEGIRNSALSEKLQLDAALTLDSAITQVRQSEAIKGQQQLLRGDSLVGSVTPRQGNTDQKGGSPGAKCPKCGWKATHDLHHCPARNVVCRKCHKRGHFQYVCRSQVLSVNTKETATGDAFLGTLGARESPWEVTFRIDNKSITFNIDTGAEVTVVSEATHRHIGSPVLIPPDRCLKGPDSHTLSTLGYFPTTLTTGGTRLYSVCMLYRDLIAPCWEDQLSRDWGYCRESKPSQAKARISSDNDSLISSLAWGKWMVTIPSNSKKVRSHM
jgi:hypothetical protein